MDTRLRAGLRHLGIATLVGPAIGGIFAEFGIWRWAFFVLVPLAVLLGALAVKVVPARSSEAGMATLPIRQIALVVAAVLALSTAGALSGNTAAAAILTGGALAAILALGRAERRSAQKLLPTGTFVFGTALSSLFAIMALLQMVIACDIFVPYFLQSLHGIGPLAAGYMVALVAAGWSLASLATAGWTGGRARLLIAGGPVLIFASAIGLAVFMGRSNMSADPAILVPIGLSLFMMGVGMGMASTQLTPRAMAAAPEGEHDVTSAALSTMPLFATGMGAALGGLIVNVAGLPESSSPNVPANWLYGFFVIVAALSIPLGFRIARTEDRDAKAASWGPGPATG